MSAKLLGLTCLYFTFYLVVGTFWLALVIYVSRQTAWGLWGDALFMAAVGSAFATAEMVWRAYRKAKR